MHWPRKIHTREMLTKEMNESVQRQIPEIYSQ